MTGRSARNSSVPARWSSSKITVSVDAGRTPAPAIFSVPTTVNVCGSGSLARVHAADHDWPGSEAAGMYINFDGGQQIPTYSLADLYACAQAGNGDYFHRASGPCATGGGSCAGRSVSGDKIAGAGLALWYAVTRSFVLTTGLDVAVGIPNRMINTDLSAGLAVRF